MFAEIETIIINRLREKLSADVHVGPVRELEAVREMRQKAPACWVVYDGFNVGEVVPPGSIQKVELDWFVVIAARSARGNGATDEARDAASELCSEVLSALLGYHLGGGRYLRLADAPGPEYDAGYCHVPLAFKCAATFKGQP